ncbi:unnamed protein product, partial [Symbiodinium necroappetens]
ILHSLPATCAQALACVQAARAGISAEAFPHLIAAVPQPASQWGLLVATPLWSPHERLLILDARAYNGALFAVQSPIFADRDAVLRLAGIPPENFVQVYSAMDRLFLVSGHEVRIFPGLCLHITRTGEPVQAYFLEEMLHDNTVWRDGPDLPVPRTTCYCCVSVRGHFLYATDPSQPWAMRSEIANAAGLSPRDMQITPSDPQIVDCEVYGIACRTVLAALPQAGHRFGVLVDCRPLLQGWLVLCSSGVVTFPELEQDIGTFVPPHWELHVHPEPLPDGRILVRPGQILIAMYRPWVPILPAMDEPGQSDTGSSSDHSTGSTPASDQDDDDSSDQPSGRAFTAVSPMIRGVMVPVTTPLLQATMTSPLSFLLLEAVALLVIACFHGLNRSHCLPVAAPVDDDNSDLQELSGQIGPTLLTQCVQDPECQAFFLAATLLEVLEEHQEDSQQVHMQPSGSSGQALVEAPTRIRLADARPLSVHQQRALGLEQVLPHAQPASLDAHQDWLDNELDSLLHDRKIPLALRTAFANLQLWHQQGQPLPYLVEVFTDGSASTSPEDLVPCAWALAVWLHCSSGSFLLGHSSSIASPPELPYHVGECDDTAQTAEYLGIIWGLAWVSEFGWHFRVPVHFRYDATGVGQAVFGTARAPFEDSTATSKVAEVAIALRHYAQSRAQLQHSHVQGHSGNIPNELVDQLAKRARRQGEDPWHKCLPLWPSRLSKHVMLTWAWATLPNQPDVPTLFSLESEAARLQHATQPSWDPPRQGQTQQQLAAGRIHYAFRCVTFNALTLRDKGGPKVQEQLAGLGITGRKLALKHALKTLSPLFLGIQETRLREDAGQPDQDYIILQSSATPAGVGGCALWIARHVPYAEGPDGKLFVSESDVTVTSYGPRHLVANVFSRRLRLTVMVLHAPSLANHPVQVVREFWNSRSQELAKRPEGSEFLLLADTNSRVGSIVSEHIGSHDEEPENEAGELLHSFLVSTDACLPSTFPTFHSGFSGTWKQPGGDWHRLDFVIVPSRWKSFGLSSQVLEDIEFLQTRTDHLPATLFCTFARDGPKESYQVSQKHTLRPPSELYNTGQVITALQAIPPVAWPLDVDSHFACLASQLLQTATQFAPAARQAPTQQYLQPATLELVDIRGELRRYIKAENLEWNRRLAIIGFAAFCHCRNGSHFSDRARTVAGTWLSQIDHSVARAVGLLHWYGKQLRTAVAADRRTYLRGLADTAASCSLSSPKELYQAIRKAFPKAQASRRSRFTPLPVLVKQDGEIAVSSEERAECWRLHFSSQEAGEFITPQDYTRICARADKATGAVETVFDLQVIPTLAQTEQAILRLRNGKAAGPDGLTGEVFRLHPPTTARRLAPLLLKAALQLHEPVEWRGGDLMVLAKKAGSVLKCENFRSILVSNLAGKIYHKCIRTRLAQRLVPSLPPLQGGVQKGVGIEWPALAVRTFICQMHGLRKPWAVVFYDLSAAFYSVVRQSLVADPDSDQGFLKVLHALQLPTGMVRDLLSGDPCADVLFAFTLSAYLKRVGHLSSKRQVACELPIVAVYKHLGGILTSTTGPLPDLYYRQGGGYCQTPQVLHLANAPSPPLAIALARAKFLRTVLASSDDTLFGILSAHFLLHPSSSWLSQLADDVACVGEYVPSIRCLLLPGKEIPALVEAGRAEPGWWTSQVRKAIKVFAEDLARLAKTGGTGFTTPVAAPTEQAPEPPVQHGPQTDSHEACPDTVQQHLKCSLPCLERCSRLFPPLGKEEICRLEAPSRRRHKAVKAGQWSTFQGLAPPQRSPLVFGPRMPTAAERRQGLIPTEEDSLASLARHFEPSLEVSSWIREYIAGKSSEGPRTT